MAFFGKWMTKVELFACAQFMGAGCHSVHTTWMFMLQTKWDGWETDKSIILPHKSKWVSFQSHHGHETQKGKCTLIAI